MVTVYSEGSESASLIMRGSDLSAGCHKVRKSCSSLDSDFQKNTNGKARDPYDRRLTGLPINKKPVQSRMEAVIAHPAPTHNSRFQHLQILEGHP